MENKKKKNKSGLVLTIAFLAIIIFLTAWNANRFVWMMQKDLPGITPDNAIWRTGSWNTSYVEYFRFRGNLIDLYGLFNLALGKQSLDNFSLLKDGENRMQSTQEGFDREHAVSAVTALSETFAARGIPLIFVSEPPRYSQESFPVSAQVNFFGGRDSEFLQALTEAGVDVLVAKRDENVALKTDMHLTTATEFDVARQIADRLVGQGVDYRESDIIFDLANYDTERHPMYGNLVKSAGRFFTQGGDDFELFHPRFETDFTIVNPESSVEKSGDFRHTLMNGMEDRLDIDPMPYWVLDYLQYPSGFYTITNHKQEDGCKILFVMDSVAMRTAAYLALGAGQVTVIDPRGENGDTHLAEEMRSGDYDAVIVEGGGEEFFFVLNP
jgi:hypothetical protein